MKLYETTISLGKDGFSKHKNKERNFKEKIDQFFSINIKICVLKLTINHKGKRNSKCRKYEPHI